MKINGIEVIGNSFAYDGCHKIYILETKEDAAEALSYGYEIIPIAHVENAYRNSCGLEFISNWALTTHYAEQSETAKFDL